MNADLPELFTLPQLAELNGVPPHVLRYALERDPVPPIARVRHIRVWGLASLPEIQAALAAVDRRRGPGKGGGNG